MNIEIAGRKDEEVIALARALEKYQSSHPTSHAKLYRQNAASIRMRIIHDAFERLRKGERHDLIWKELEELPDDIKAQISMLLLLAPNEVKSSFANFEFDDPSPSLL